MPNRLTFEKTLHALQSAMTLSRKRHELISSSISNLETPGFKGSDIDFKAAMAQALRDPAGLAPARTRPGHLQGAPDGGLAVQSVEEAGEWNGHNYVSIENLMNKMTENNLIYKASAEALLRKLALMKEVIREGGR